MAPNSGAPGKNTFGLKGEKLAQLRVPYDAAEIRAEIYFEFSLPTPIDQVVGKIGRPRSSAPELLPLVWTGRGNCRFECCR